MESRSGETAYVKVAIVTNCAPFANGEADYLADALRSKLIDNGHSAIVVAIPFQQDPPSAIVEHMVACRSLRLPNTDLMIALRFPSCYLPHSNKVLWLTHSPPYQELPPTLEGDQIRNAVINADRVYLREARKIYTASEAASERLRGFHSIAAEVLYPPLLRSSHLRHEEYGDYVFYPGCISGDNRQVLLVEAARHLKTATRVVIAGQPRTAADLEQLRHAIAAHGLEHRVRVIPEFLPEERKADLFARALACVYTPYDQDSYGCAALEACHCRKPTITCTDSGGTSLLVVERVTGRRVSPERSLLLPPLTNLR